MRIKVFDIILTNDLFTHQAQQLCMQGSAGPTWPESVEHTTNKEASRWPSWPRKMDRSGKRTLWLSKYFNWLENHNSASARNMKILSPILVFLCSNSLRFKGYRKFKFKGYSQVERIQKGQADVLLVFY